MAERTKKSSFDLYKIGTSPEELRDALVALRQEFDSHNHDGSNSKSFQTLLADIIIARGGLIASGGPKGASSPFSVDKLGNLTANSAKLGFLTWSKLVLLSSFESLDGWITAVVGTGANTVGFGCCQLSAGTNADIAGFTIDPLDSGRYINFAKNPMFQTTCNVNFTTNFTAHIAAGSPTTTKYFGFKIVGTTVSAINKDTGSETATTLSGVTATSSNTYRAEMTSGSKILFYVNDVLKATHTTNLPTTTTSRLFFYRLIKDAVDAENKKLFINNFLFIQDL